MVLHALSTFHNISTRKCRHKRRIVWLIWVKSDFFHPCIANFTPKTINIDIIFTISIIIETNTNLMTKSGHKHRTLNTSEWISSTTIDLPRKTDEKTRATRLATDWRMLPQGNFWTKAEPKVLANEWMEVYLHFKREQQKFADGNDASRVPGLLLLLPGKRRVQKLLP